MIEGGDRLETRLGERPHITFVYGDAAFPDDKAGAEGAIPLKCVLQCNGHKRLQDGLITVSGGSGRVQPTTVEIEGRPAATARR